MVLFFLVAVMAIPTFVTGGAAERVLCPELQCPPDINPVTIRKHEDIALFAFALMEITGFFSWLGLWQLRRRAISTAHWTVVLLAAVVTFAFMAWAAMEGGEIRHPEIRAASEAAETAANETEPPTGVAREIGAVIAGNTGIGWIWPACEALHFVGLCMLFAVVLSVDLRILGLARALSFQALYQLLPFGMLGFILNLATGMAFFLAAPGQYVNNVEFHRKLIFIILAGVNVLYFMLADEAWMIKENGDAPFRAKAVAAITIFIWIGILYYGHMLPFLGNAF
jgi:hypothetical protein